MAFGGNEHERERWNHPGFASGWRRREGLSEATTDALLRRAALVPGERVLDIGCGSGPSTLAAARAVAPSGTVVGVDFSEPLLEAARQRVAAAGAGGVSFVLADAETASIDAAPFDAAVSQLGVLFFADSVAAFANVGRQLVAGGRLTFSCWQPAEANPWHVAPLLRRFATSDDNHAQGAAAGSGPGPFRFGDPAVPEQILADAGFVDISRDEIRAVARLPRSAAYDSSMLLAVGVPEERAAEAEEAVASYLERYRASGDEYDLPLAYAIWSAARR